MSYNPDKINEMADGDEDFITSVVSVFLEKVPVDLLGTEQTRATALGIETFG